MAFIRRGVTADALTMMPFTIMSLLICSAPILRSGVSTGSPLILTWIIWIWSAYSRSRIRSFERAAASNWGRWSSGLASTFLASSASKA